MNINGIEYIERPIKDHKPSTASLGLMTVMAMCGGRFHGFKRSMEYDDLINEYTLVQNKESSLSKKEREYVVYLFNKKYIPKYL